MHVKRNIIHYCSCLSTDFYGEISPVNTRSAHNRHSFTPRTVDIVGTDLIIVDFSRKGNESWRSANPGQNRTLDVLSVGAKLFSILFSEIGALLLYCLEVNFESCEWRNRAYPELRLTTPNCAVSQVTITAV